MKSAAPAPAGPDAATACPMPRNGPRAGWGRRLWLALIVAGTLAYYFWTGMLAAGGAPRIHGQESDHFNLLSRGLKSGHLYLDGEVPAGLLTAKNPYDPALRQSVTVLHDASYFRGKYYIYFGPAPVVTLLLPFSLVTGRDLPLPYAVWFFSCVGYLALVSAFLLLQRRYFPRASLWTVTAGLIAIGGASMVVALLRRAHIWEISAASGFGFFSVSLLCLLRALLSRRPAAWAVAGGFALGLAVASRPTYLLCSVLFALPVLVGWMKRDAIPRYSWRALLGAAVGCGIPVLALFAYNYARFGEFLEFGQRYQLSAIIEGDARHFSLGYVPFNAHVYFLSALRWLPYFPFHHGVVVPPIPTDHAGYEYTIGLFSNLPFSLLCLLPVGALLMSRSRRAIPSPLALSIAVIATAAVINAGILLCYFGSCIRYMVDFTPCVMLLAAVGALVGETWLRGPLARGLWRGTTLVLAAFSAFFAAASVVEFYDPVPGEPPAAYRPVARVLNLPYFLLQRQRFPDYGPREIVLSFPTDRSRRQEPLVSVRQAQGETAVVFIDYLDDQKIRLGYREPGNARPPVFSPAVAAPPGARHTLRLSIGGRYAEYDGLRSRLRAQFDNVLFWSVPVVSFGTYPGELRVGADAAPAATGPSFTGVIASVRPIAMPTLPRTTMTGIRVRLALKPDMAGKAYPLLTSGRTKAGDMFFVRVHSPEKISFGYDHWGAPLISSPDVAVAPGTDPVVEFWAPALSPRGSPQELVVKVNGVSVWRQPAPAFPSTPDTLFLGSNPIGGSTCEPALENAVFEDLQLPPPAR